MEQELLEHHMLLLVHTCYLNLNLNFECECCTQAMWEMEQALLEHHKLLLEHRLCNQYASFGPNGLPCAAASISTPSRTTTQTPGKSNRAVAEEEQERGARGGLGPDPLKLDLWDIDSLFMDAMYQYVLGAGA